MTAIPWHVAPETHLFFALTLFYGGGLYIALQCVIDGVVGHIDGALRERPLRPWRRTKEQSERAKRLRSLHSS